MTTLRWSVGVLALVLATAPSALAQQPSPAGRIKVASGSAFIVRAGATVPARPGTSCSRPTASGPAPMEASASR